MIDSSKVKLGMWYVYVPTGQVFQVVPNQCSCLGQPEIFMYGNLMANPKFYEQANPGETTNRPPTKMAAWA